MERYVDNILCLIIVQTYSNLKMVLQSDTSEWQQGMKLELLDPLGATMSDLQVATVLDIKRVRYHFL